MSGLARARLGQRKYRRDLPAKDRETFAKL
jgi:hypothetical protein